MKKHYNEKLSKEDFSFIIRTKRIIETVFLLPKKSLDVVPHRHRALVVTMQIAQYLVRGHNAKIAYIDIGSLIGYKDHANVMHGILKIKEGINIYADLKEVVSFLNDRINGIDAKCNIRELSIGNKSIKINPHLVAGYVDEKEEDEIIEVQPIKQTKKTKKYDIEEKLPSVYEIEKYATRGIISYSLVKKYNYAREEVVKYPYDFNRKSHYNYILATIQLAVITHDFEEKHDSGTLRQIDMLENRILCHRRRFVPTQRRDIALRMAKPMIEGTALKIIEDQFNLIYT